jgi:hypothetical protein
MKMLFLFLIFLTAFSISGCSIAEPSNDLDIGCSVASIVNQNINPSTMTWVIFGQELYDTDNMFSSTQPTKIYINHAGKYIVSAQVYWNYYGVGGYRRELYIYINRAQAPSATSDLYETVGGGAINQECSGVVKLNKGDYVELRAYQNSGTGLVLYAYPPDVSSLRVQRIGID